MSQRSMACLVGAVLLLGSSVFGQQQPPPGGDGPPPDFAQMRQQMMARMKDMLGAPDDEWKVIEPKIEAIQQLQRDARGRGMGMPGPGGPPPGTPGNSFDRNGPPPGPDQAGPPRGPDGLDNNPANAAQPSDVQQKSADLHAALNSSDAAPDEIKTKLAALRDARTAAKARLIQAQTDLRGLLSVREEAVLVSIGLLD